MHTQVHKSKGFTLIEILIATVITAIGLLGMAGIQLKGMRSTQSTSLSTEAINIANDIAERMLSNPRAAQNNIGPKRGNDIDVIDGNLLVDNQYAFDNNGNNITSAGFNCGSVVTQCRGTTATCSTTQLASYDIKSWICGVPTNGGGLQGGIGWRLPNGLGTITCIDNNPNDNDACTPGSTHNIAVSWNETSTITGIVAQRTITIHAVP